MLFVSLDLILIVLAVLSILGIGWGIMIGSWLWSHAIIIGIVLLVIHIVLSFGYIIIGAETYKIVGVVLAIFRAIFPPIIIVSAYKMTVASGKDFGGALLFQWFLIFGLVGGIECLWNKAFETRDGLWYLRLIGMTALAIAASVLLTRIILVEGF